ncbi:hypothetical protein OKW24_001385 [Peribacillus simplex]|nr:hypothetical protein [Peribacillus simplex]MDF9759612.1 hypothetical protein [Peribacillus simplex]
MKKSNRGQIEVLNIQSAEAIAFEDSVMGFIWFYMLWLYMLD